MTTENDKIFDGPIPQMYHRHIGPVLFQPFARIVAQQISAEDRTVLETAAGTGIVTLAITKIAPHCTVVATDLNQGMLDVAASEVRDKGLTFQMADAQALPFSPDAFDVVVCSFGIMFMPDKLGAYREAFRVLRDSGRLIFTVWASLAENPLPQISHEVVARLFEHDPPSFLARTPFGYSDRMSIERALLEAGFSAVDFNVVEKEASAPSAWEAAMGFCQGTPLRREIEARDPEGLIRATEAVASAIEKRFGNGPVRAPMLALLVTATK